MATASHSTLVRYQYTTLAEIETKLNDLAVYIFAIVDRFDYIPNADPNGRGQFELKLNLIDDSHKDESSSSSSITNIVICRVFADNQRSLPAVRRRGDIIRLHRVTVRKTSNDELYIIGRIGVRGMHAVVWDGAHGSSIEPRSKTSTNATLLDDDRHRICQLRDYLLHHKIIDLDSELRFCSLIKRKYHDIICQVIGIIRTEKNEDVIRAWDGTRLPFSSFVYPLNENNESRIDRKLAKRAYDLAYDIICYDVFGKKARGLAVGSIVHLINVHVAMRDDETCAFMTMHGPVTHGRSIVALSQTDNRYQSLLKELEACRPVQTEHESTTEVTDEDEEDTMMEDQDSG